MLTTAEIRAHLDTRTYAADYWFDVYDGEFEGQHLVIGATLPDAYHPGQDYVVVRVECFLPPIPDTAYLDRWMVWRLSRIAAHEVREFWRDRATGRPVFDPHAEWAERDGDAAPAASAAAQSDEQGSRVRSLTADERTAYEAGNGVPAGVAFSCSAVAPSVRYVFMSGEASTCTYDDEDRR